MARVAKEVFPPEHCNSVQEYERTPYWRKKSQKLMEDKECVCEICGRKRWKWMPRKKKWKRLRFVSHHVRYSNLPNEKPEDIMVICWQCHDLFHLLLRLESWGGVFVKLAEIARTVFLYEGNSTFTAW